MKKIYQLSDKGVNKHLGRFGLLFLAGVVMAVVVVYFGLQRLPGESYRWVNLPLLLVDAVCINLLCHLGGYLDGKKDKNKQALIILGATVGAAVLVWLVLLIAGLHSMAAGLIFITNLALVAALLYKVWNMLKNMWHAVGDNVDKNGDEIQLPGEYLLSQVHATDSLTSPMGWVLIQGNAVMFVYINQLKGHVLVRPNGEIDIRQEKLLKDNTTKSSKLSVYDLLQTAESGAKRVMEIVEKECAARNVPVPAMRYGYALFMPYFERENYVFNEDSFHRYPYFERMSSYKSYLTAANKTDVFRGHACFNRHELHWMANTLCDTRSQEEAARSNGQLVAECIASACDLVLKEK